MEKLKQTPFTAQHRMLGAKMAEFAGYEMPIEYTGIAAEHMAAIENGAIFDVSHMGQFAFLYERGYNLLQYLTCNDIGELKQGDCQYSCLMKEDGCVVDDVVIYCIEEKVYYIMVVNAANVEKDFAHVVKYAEMFDASPGDHADNLSNYMSMIAVQGPKARLMLQSIYREPIMDMSRYKNMLLFKDNIGEALFGSTGYTGLGGGELIVDMRHTDCSKLFAKLLQIKDEYGIVMAGLGARDTLRLEMGYCLYGHELSESISPLQANLGWIVKLNHDFLGSKALQKQKEDGLNKKLVGLKMLERGVPRSNYALCSSSGNEIGCITSGAITPYCNQGIALGYVSTENSAIGTNVYVKIREKLLMMEVVKPPFRKLQAINLTSQ